MCFFFILIAIAKGRRFVMGLYPAADTCRVIGDLRQKLEKAFG